MTETKCTKCGIVISRIDGHRQNNAKVRLNKICEFCNRAQARKWSQFKRVLSRWEISSDMYRYFKKTRPYAYCRCDTCGDTKNVCRLMWYRTEAHEYRPDELPLDLLSDPHSYHSLLYQSVCMDCVLRLDQLEKDGQTTDLEEILISLDPEESIRQKAAITFSETGRELNVGSLFRSRRPKKRHRKNLGILDALHAHFE